MAIYSLQCKKCGHLYDVMSLMFEKDININKAKCPECNSRLKMELIGCPSFAFSNPEGTDRYNNSHDYRWKHKIDKPDGVKDERKAAEQVSKVGPQPYAPIDDVSSGKHFGEVK